MRTLTGLLCVVFLWVSSGCQPSESGSKVIGVTLLTRNHEFYKDLEEGLDSAARAYGYLLRVNAAELDLARQMSQIEDFITQRVDAVIIAPADSQGIVPAIEKLNQKNIPVFTADIAAGGGRVISHIASDNHAGGAKAAEYLCSLVTAGEIAILNHPIGTSVLDRVAGFREDLARRGRYDIVADLNGEGVRDRAMNVMSDLLQAHPNLKGVFCINDPTALGALDAVNSFGRKEIVLIGYDATAEAREKIKQGTALRADVIQFPKQIGQRTIEAIHQYFSGQTPPSRIDVPVGIYDKNSAP